MRSCCHHGFWALWANNPQLTKRKNTYQEVHGSSENGIMRKRKALIKIIGTLS